MNADAPRAIPQNFVEHLRALAALRPHDTGLVVVRDEQGETIDEPLSYALLDRRVRALAAELQRFERGSRVLLLLENDDHYVVAFFACLYAGMVAVPVFPPESTRPQHLARLLGIGRDAKASCVLTTSALLGGFGAAMFASFEATTLAVDTVPLTRADECTPCTPADDDIALLQYTSGSTSAPKGVMITHGNLIANARVIEEGFCVGADDVFVSWLPLFHDMGLVGGLLQPIHRGIKAVLLTPRLFVERPVRWLEAISRHRGTVSGGPNFAFRLCLERVSDAQLARLDLSSWRVAFCGAEPIQPEVLRKMAARFAHAGLDARALSPCYGLAEATLYVTGAERGVGMIAHSFAAEALARGAAELADDGRTLVSCGRSVSSHPFQVMDPSTLAPVAAGRLGEIWTTGASVARGYWNKPEATRECFVTWGERTWLRTGDLGFLHDGQLYVAGRVKDLIIVRGQNLYPQDLEQAIESEVDAVRKGRVAAFSVPGESGEGIGIAVEVSRGMQKLVDHAALVEAIGVAVSESCGEAPSVVMLLNPGGLPKTSSGKLQRNACRAGWAERSLNAYAIHERGRFVVGGSRAMSGIATDADPQDDLESTLIALWRSIIGLSEDTPLAADAHFLNLGGNSLHATQLAARIAAHWGLQVGLREIFEHPRLAQLAAEIRRRIKAEQQQRPPQIPRLSSDTGAGLHPLSRAQERQWFLHQLDPNGSAYHIGVALRIRGRLDSSAVGAAFQELCARHDSLRTLFRTRADGTPEQVVLAQLPLALNEFDLRERAANQREELLAEIAQRALVEPFDLTRGPLLRVSLVRLEDQAYVLVLVLHHIVSDGWSMQLLLDEWSALYSARAEQRAATLPELPIRYVDYASWQREWCASAENERQLTYWKEQLGKEQPVLRMATEHPRRVDGRYAASQHRFQLDAELNAAISGRACERGATRFMLLLTALQVLLHRHTGQRDIRIGVPVANRHRLQTTAVVGLFVNTQVIRARFDGRDTLSFVLEQAKEAALGAQAHQELPFEQLVEALQPARSLGQSPLFQVLFNHLQEDYRALSGLPGLSVERYALGEQDAQFELAFETCEQRDGTLACSIRYAKELFAPAAIERLGEQLLIILRSLCQHPERRISEIELLARDERAQIERWSINGQRFERAESVVHAIERQARERPEATALVFRNDELSYRELNRRANRLAHRLLGLGVRPEMKLGILAERSLAMVVGLLAILKAGAAYVPLDPELPPERLSFMLEDSGIELLLAQGALCTRCALGLTRPTLELDALDLVQGPDCDPAVPLHGDQLAYVIYTSGSTGRPKGVANRHRSLSNRLHWMQQQYALGATDTVLQKTPFSFDVSVWEFFWPLMVGARLALAGPNDHRDPARLVELIQQHSVTTLHFVPSMLQAFLAYPESAACVTLRRMVCSGEVLAADTQQQVFQRLPGVSLHNLYGPTEAAIDVTHWTCRDDQRGHVAIGQPISDTKTYLLDADLNLAPTGAAGELYLGGIGLARGYVGRAGLSAERFVPDPFAEDGARLYRTGDWARFRADGQLEYLGRADQQLKIRGFRVELGEIEAQLLRQGELREAAVVAKTGPTGLELVAYVALVTGAALEAGPLRERLARTLPDYMVPARIVFLDQLPLGPNGKLDRNALPEPSSAAALVSEAPLGHTEQALSRIWADVLEVESVGRADNFFDLGGHSLLLTRIQVKIREHFARQLTIVDLFRYPTVAGLASFLSQPAPNAGDPRPAEDAERRAEQQRAAFSRRKAATGRTPR